MSKYVDLTKILTKLPDFAFDYIEMAYDGESVNTQIGYSIDIKTFLEYLKSKDLAAALKKGTWCAARNAENEAPGSII